MRVLALDAATGRCMAALVEDGAVLAARHAEGGRGHAAVLPPMAAAVLESGRPALIAVTVGPGSFTGLRAALSLAHGLALGLDVPVVGVGVAEALRADAPNAAAWVAIGSRRGRVFLDRGAGIEARALDALPRPPHPVRLLGDAAASVAEVLGDGSCSIGPAWPEPAAVAAIGLRRRHGALPPLPARALYVDAPEARPGAQRPIPA